MQRRQVHSIWVIVYGFIVYGQAGSKIILVIYTVFYLPRPKGDHWSHLVEVCKGGWLELSVPISCCKCD